MFPKSIINELWLLNYVELQQHYLRPEPVQGISKLSGCLEPPWPPEGPQEWPKWNYSLFVFLFLYYSWYIMSMDNVNYTKAQY